MWDPNPTGFMNMCVCIYIHIYIYIYRERDRERERETEKLSPCFPMHNLRKGDMRHHKKVAIYKPGRELSSETK